MESNVNKTAKKWKQVGIGLLALALVGAPDSKTENRNDREGRGRPGYVSDPGRGRQPYWPRQQGAAMKPRLKKFWELTQRPSSVRETRTQTRLQWTLFATKYAKMNRWVDMTDGSRVLYIGADNFAFPVPLAKNSSGQWYFDGIAGAEEVRTRNIGRNELLTIDACAALAAAQQMYFTNGVESGEYAQHIVSTSGKQDGLYWPDSKNQALSPLASLNEFPKSSLASISPGQPLVIDGYTLRILTAQGDEAPGAR